MVSVDPSVLEKNDLPELELLPRSRDALTEVLEKVTKKEAAARDFARRQRQERFKSRKQQAPKPIHCSGHTQVSEEIPPEVLQRIEDAARARPEVQLSFRTQLEVALAAVPEGHRQKLEALIKDFPITPSPAVVEQPHEDEASSETSEDLGEEARIREVDLQCEAIVAELARIRPRLPRLCQADLIGNEDVESTTASRGTSLCREIHASAPSSARSCSDAGSSQMATLTFFQDSQELPVELQETPNDPPLEEPVLSAVAPPRHGKGKGKGKAPKAPAPPPPKASAPKAKATATATNLPKTNGLVNVFWQVTKEEDTSSCGKEFEQRLEAKIISDGVIAIDTEEPSLLSLIPKRPETIFSPLDGLEEVPRAVVEHFFQKRKETGAWRHAANEADDAPGKRATLLDQKCLHMLGITLQKYHHKHKVGNSLQAILNIKRAVLRCDFEVVCFAALGVIRTALRQHEAAERPVCTYVNSHGDFALERLQCPDEHRLIYELSKVPQIDERLECMLFHVMFQESLCSYRTNLNTLLKVLEMLKRKRETLQRFFMTALRLGQSLNRESNAPKAPNGFQLSSLEKLSQTKSTKLPRLSILHFILALMSKQDAQALFDSDDLALLQEARTLKTHKIFTDCIELVQGLYGVQQICDTGKYVNPFTGQAVTIERRRRSLPANTSLPSHDQEPAVDTDDRFHEVMKEFVDTNLEAAEDLGEGASGLILLYKELAIYFDDMRNVYPPPKSENDSRRDLVDVFSRFAFEIQRHRDQVESEGLRELLHQAGVQGTCPNESSKNIQDL